MSKKDDDMRPDLTDDDHYYTGHPGSYCLKCFNWDPIEQAIADNVYNPYSDEWASEEIKQEVLDKLVCPVKGKLVWDKEKFEWKLIKPKQNIVSLGKAHVKLKMPHK